MLDGRTRMEIIPVNANIKEAHGKMLFKGCVSKDDVIQEALTLNCPEEIHLNSTFICPDLENFFSFSYRVRVTSVCRLRQFL